MDFQERIKLLRKAQENILQANREIRKAGGAQAGNPLSDIKVELDRLCGDPLQNEITGLQLIINTFRQADRDINSSMNYTDKILNLILGNNGK